MFCTYLFGQTVRLMHGTLLPSITLFMRMYIRKMVLTKWRPFVRISNGWAYGFHSHLKSRPFATQPLFNHSKSRLVQISDPHCSTYFMHISFLVGTKGCISMVECTVWIQIPGHHDNRLALVQVFTCQIQKSLSEKHTFCMTFKW